MSTVPRESMHSSMIKIAYFAVLFVSVYPINVSRIDEGYPVGFMTNCPGSLKPVDIEPKALKRLYISLLGPGPVLHATWTPYNYYQIENLAKNPGMDFNRKTVLYVGGYLEFTALPIGRAIGEIYGHFGYNVLILDTVEFTAHDYVIAARIVRTVGKRVAEMLFRLAPLGLEPEKLELVGLSLGGQTMSFIAKHYRELTGKNISSLTGIDTAGPCFRHLGPDLRLDNSDADFVRTIITNADGYGMSTPVGHVNFYINGGEYQPGDLPKHPCFIECSHIKSINIWLSALQHPKKFIGIQCNSVQQARDADCYDREPMVTNILGLFTDRNKPGIYFVATSAKYPYGLGKKGLKRETKGLLPHLKWLGNRKVR